MKKILSALLGAALSLPVSAATYVYVSNADDGDIGMYTLTVDGHLQPGARVKAGPNVMPMTVSPDKRFLVAASRAKPFTAHTYAIDRASGALKPVGTGAARRELPVHHLRPQRPLPAERVLRRQRGEREPGGQRRQGAASPSR